jgi:coenzyme F420-reducing hydrogenase delta subunit
MADQKLTALTETTSIDGTELLYVVEDPSGTPLSRKVTIDNVSTFFDALTQTLTNKTIDAANNTLSLTTDSVDAITEIAAALKSGSDVTLITGTAGTNGNLAQWNVDGDLVDGATPPAGAIVGTSDTQTLTNKTIAAASNTITLTADSVDAITEIAAALKSGADGTLITGTAGVNGDLSIWNIDGDLVDGPTPPSGTIVGTSDSQTLTNKTIAAASNTISLTADSVDAITEIAAALKSGSDLTLITGTAGTANDLAIWNADGDLVDGPTPPSGAIVGISDSQTLTNKTIAAANNTISLTADSVDAITEIAAALKSGADGTLITGTAGTASDLSIWNADGDLVDGPTPPSGTIVGTTDTQTLTNKTLGATTLSGQLSAADQTIERPVIKDYGETLTTNATSGATETLDLTNGNVFDVTLSANCTFTFSNPPASGTAGSFTLILRQDGTGSRTATWPASVDWPSATAPTLSTGASDVDVFTFLTVDGGTTWLGFTAGLDLS